MWKPAIGYSEHENIRRIDIFVYPICFPETMPMSSIVKKLSVLFSKQSILPTWRQASSYLFNNDFNLMKIKTQNF